MKKRVQHLLSVLLVLCMAFALNPETPVNQAPDADIPEAIAVPEEENSDNNSDSLADAE